jgi:hypothetical protein
MHVLSTFEKHGTMFPGLLTFEKMARKQCFLVFPPSGNMARKQYFLVCPSSRNMAIGNNISWFVHLQETWLGNINVSWFVRLQETWLGNNVS